MKHVKANIRVLLATLLMLPHMLCGQAVGIVQSGEDGSLPRWGIKTNLLYDATATFNLGVELRTGSSTSFDLSGNWNPFTFSENRKWKHYLVQPELRWWRQEVFRGHFFGIQGLYSLYNVSRLPAPPFSDYMAAHRFEGWLAGVGLSYGYRWNFSRHWALEATVGAGYVYFSYDKFPCEWCGEFIGSEAKHRLSLTKAGITLAYSMGLLEISDKERGVHVGTQVSAPVARFGTRLLNLFSIRRADTTARVYSKSGAAHLDFAEGEVEILPLYHGNDVELKSIHKLLRKLANNPRAKLINITIIGRASPDGDAAENLLLSERRAQELKRYIQAEHGLSDSLFVLQGAGEDWKGLERLVKQSFISNKRQALEIIRHTDDIEERKSKLMALGKGKTYRQMEKRLFPLLRRMEYHINYRLVEKVTRK